MNPEATTLAPSAAVAPRPGSVVAPGRGTADGFTSTDATQFRTAAAFYISKGWHPIPIRAAEPGNPDSGKCPLQKGWQDARTGGADVLQLWPDTEPRNLGITCGPSRLVVLDFDEDDAFPTWAAAHPDAAKTFTVKRSNAPEGRRHLYFSLAEGQPAPAQLTKAATGWGDLKTAGGQVVAPPSIHYTGGRYETLNADAAVLPWRDEYTPAPYAPGIPKRTPPPAPARPQPPRNAAPGIPPSVQGLIDTGAAKGARNQTAFAIAAQLRDEGHGERAALAIVQDFARRCSPPLSDSETARTVASAYKAAPREPARDPTRPAYTPRTERPAVIVEQGPPAPTPETDWPKPEPLGGLSSTVPRWPWEVYPAPLRRLGEAIAQTMNAPPELTGLALLAAASIAAGKRARVEIKPGHVQFPNLFALAALHVGHGKTPTAKPVLRPLIDRQIELREAHREALRAWEARWKIAKAQTATLERQAGKIGAEANADELARKLASLAAIEEERPAPPVLFLDNATSEAMARTLAGNGGSLGVFSADARDVLAVARGKYSKDCDDIGVFLKGHAGDYLAVHRAALDKPSFECPEPVLAVFLAVQLDALQALGAAVAFRESGFLARFLYAVPPPPERIEYPVETIPGDILEDYGAALRALLTMPRANDAEGQPCPHLCRLSPAAFDAWKTFHDATKRAALTAPPLMAQCLNKTPEHLARIALVFHLVEAAASGRTPGEIQAAEIERAATLAEVLKAHTARAVALMGETTERAAARQLWPLLERNRERLAELRAADKLGPIQAVKPRDVARFGWGGIEDAEQARAALEALETKGWLRLRTVEAPGARPHVLFELHPNPTGAKEGGAILL